MDAIGWLIDMIIYMGIATALAGTALARLSEQDAPPGASPWRRRGARRLARQSEATPDRATPGG